MKDTSVTVDVLANDSDVDGDSLSVDSVTDPVNGTVTNNNSDVTYTPDENFTGTDTFDYTVTDGNGGTDTATVDITISPVNDAPVAVDDSAATDEDTSVTVDVLANDSDVDGDILSVSGSDTTSAHGGTVIYNGDGTFDYTPLADFSGEDMFEYTLSDDNGETDTAAVTIVVNAIPDAIADTGSTDQDTPITVDVMSNDDLGDLPTTIELVVDAENRSVEVNDDGSITYTPDPDFAGTYEFTYGIIDRDGDSDEATVTIDVSGVITGEAAARETSPITTIITSPENGLVTEQGKRIVTYEILGDDLSRATFFHNTESTDIDPESGSITIDLIVGINVLQVQATNEDGATASSEEVTVRFVPPLEVIITYSPAMAFAGSGGTYVTISSVEVRGTVSDPEISEATLIVNDTREVSISVHSGYFEHDLTLETEGLNTIRAEATDARGNTDSSGTVGVIYVPEKLIVEVLNPPDGYTANTEVVTVEGRIIHGAPVESAILYLNGEGTQIDLTKEADSYTYSFSETITLREGENTFAVEGTDELGNSGSSGTMFGILDTTPPQVEITTPATSYLTNTGTLSVTGTVDDPAVTEVRVDVGGSQQTLTVTQSSFSGQVGLSEGPNTITASVIDPVGNERASQTIDVTYNPAAPVATIISPVGGTKTNSDTVTVNYTISDDATSAQFILNGNPEQVASESGSTTVSLVEGANTIELRASNETITASSGVVTVVSDTTAPSMSVDVSSPWKEVVVTVYADEALSSAPTITVTGTNTTNVDMALTGIRQWSGTYEIPEDGTYIVEATAADEAGNGSSCVSSFSRKKETVSAAAGDTITVESNRLTVNIEIDEEVNDQSISTVLRYEDPRLGRVTEPAILVRVKTGVPLRWAMTRMTVKAIYDPTKLPEGMPESSLLLYLWTPSKGGYVPVQGATVDPGQNTISGTVTY